MLAKANLSNPYTISFSQSYVNRNTNSLGVYEKIILYSVADYTVINL